MVRSELHQEMSLLVLKLVNKAGKHNGSCFRGTVAPDGLQYYAVYDAVNFCCNKPEKSSYANTTFFRLTQEGSEYRDEVLTLCKNLKFPGKGQRETPCMTIRGLQRLLMILGGKIAAEFREIVEGTFTRVMAGDQSLIEVINANAASQDPVQKAYRAGLAQEPVDPVLDDFCLKRKRERDEKLLDLDLAERTLRLEQDKHLLEEGKHRLDLSKRDEGLDHVGKFVKLFEAINELPNIDEEIRLNLREKAKDVLLSTPSTSSAAASKDEPTLFVSKVAEKMGFNCTESEIISIGRLMAKKYRAVHDGRDPSKREQKIKGITVLVNSYTEQDLVMLEQAVQEVMGTQ